MNEQMRYAMSGTRCHIAVTTLFAFVLTSACSPSPGNNAGESARSVPPAQPVASEDATSGTGVNELVGQLRFVFLEQEAVFAYWVRGSRAFLMRPTESTVYTGIAPIAPGDGIGFAGRLMHSASTYRLRGTASDDATEQLRLVSLNTRRFTLESVELVEAGRGPCNVYFGVLVPPVGGSGGFVPVLPESARGKKGTFVQDGTGTCKVVMADTGRGQQATNSLSSDGALNMNKQVAWATGESN